MIIEDHTSKDAVESNDWQPSGVSSWGSTIFRAARVERKVVDAARIESDLTLRNISFYFGNMR